MSMRTKNPLLAAALCAGLCGSAHAIEFTNAYIVGDSLSDAGQYGSRFTTNPGLTASEYLAQVYGLTIKPSSRGGTDYAWGGARITSQGSYVPLATPVAGQVTHLINASGGQLDPGALYVIQGGPDDIFYHAGVVAAGGESAAAAQAAIGTAASDFLAQIVRLHNAGARYIVVFNLPDMGRTPDALATGAAGAAALSGLSVSVFNSVLGNGLAALGFDVIPANTQALLNEVLADPALFGFTNVATPACTSVFNGSVSALACTPSTLVSPNAASTYAFADGVHPTSTLHKIFAQYTASVIAAPEQIGLLAEAPLAISAAQGRIVESRTQSPSPGAGKTAIYGGYEFGKADIDPSAATIGLNGDVSSLNLGADYQATDTLRVGALLGYSENKADFGNSAGGFKLGETMLTGYASFNPGPWYVGGSVGAGTLDFKNIRRDIELGPAIRSETSRTQGNHLVARLVGGANFGNQTFSHGPIASLSWQQVKVYSFGEDGLNSTSMNFGQQERKSLLSSIGYLASAHFGGSIGLTPWIRVAWENEHGNDNRDVRASLVTMGGSFALPTYKVDDDYGKVDVGVAAQFNRSLSGFVNYSTTFSQANQKTDAVMVGLKLAM
jgi:outer membrane lipase/esterase